MVFLRTKIISGKTYFYLVESKRIDGKVRQKVVKYIGTQENLGNMISEMKE